MYTVYWYKRPQFKDPYTEGYIGITNNLARRNLEHRRNRRQTHLTHALACYDDIELVTLHIVPLEEALALEYEYRPALNIAWNHAIGGKDTLKSIKVAPISLYHKDNYVQLRTFLSITEAAKALKISEGRIRQAKHRGTTSYGYDGWAILHDPMHDRSTTISIGSVRSIQLLGSKRNKPSHFKGLTNRWSEADKQRISKQHKGKVISEAQKLTVRQKNQASHSSCKTITLQHSSGEATYTYHSISEASRQLNIPLARLKSKAQRPLNRFGNDGWAIISLGSE